MRSLMISDRDPRLAERGLLPTRLPTNTVAPMFALSSLICVLLRCQKRRHGHSLTDWIFVFLENCRKAPTRDPARRCFTLSCMFVAAGSLRSYVHHYTHPVIPHVHGSRQDHDGPPGRRPKHSHRRYVDEQKEQTVFVGE
ncbi:hypothetical protein BDW22DRAFT_602381 [Trametopsis cervina]|nr:hypothetical protein BDW22DRAFT_602381 [Trametopsis cervina]